MILSRYHLFKSGLVLYTIFFILCAWLTATQALAAGPLAIHVTHGANESCPGVTVYLGTRHAATDTDGIAIFDGLPAGPYELTIFHPGFDRVSRAIDVPAGMRQPIPIHLLASQTLDWTGQVLIDGLNQPIAGAVARLTPVAVNATLSGPVTMTSDLEGHLFATNVPLGRYAFELDAPGYDVLRQEISVEADDKKPTSFYLRRQSQAVKVSVQVRDGANKPVPKAMVTLAEVWPDGIVGNGTTDAKGMIVFDNIQVGQVNRIDATGRLDVCRRALSVRAEAAGFVPDTSRILLAKDTAEATLRLTPETGKDLRNSAPAQGETLMPNVPVTLTIDTVGQRHSFRLTLPEPALLRLMVAEGAPIETYMRLLDLEGQGIKEQGAHRGNANSFDAALAAGTYLVELEEWGNNDASPDPLTLTAQVDTAIDPLEPNNSDQEASILRPGEFAAGRIWPRGDRDVFQIEVRQPGFLCVHGPEHPLERQILIRDARQTQLGTIGANADQPIKIMVQVEPGQHFIEIREWGENNESLVPYRMQVDILPDDGLDDPLVDTGQMQAVRELMLGTQVGATLLPVGDKDVFQIKVPGAGRLHVQTSGRLERHIQLFAANGTLLTTGGSYSDQTGTLKWFVEEAGVFFVVLGEWGDNAWSTDAYALSAWLEPADMFDFKARNDDLDTATALALGETVHGNFLPLKDKDVFAVDVDFPGYLRVNALSALETCVHIFAANGTLLVKKGAHAGQNATLNPPVQIGTHYVVVEEWGNNDASVLPYTLSVHLDRAEPAESFPLPDDPPRELKDGEARSFSIDHLGDRDRFLFSVPQAAEITMSVAAPLATYLRIFDQTTDQVILEKGFHKPSKGKETLSIASPTTLRLEITEWGGNDASLEPGFILLDTQGRSLEAEKIVAQVDVSSPKKITLSREVLDYADPTRECVVDLGLPGQNPVRVPPKTEVKTEVPAQGLYTAQALCTGSSGQTSRQSFWIQATGTQDRAGILVSLNNLAEGQIVDAPLNPQAQVTSFDGTAIRRVEFVLDGKPLEPGYKPPFTTTINWPALAAGNHTLHVLATDSTGTNATLERFFTVSEYFDLNPPHQATFTGENLLISWQAPTFGPAKVRYRPQGTDDNAWTEVIGESARRKQVRLPGLKTDTVYEFQPLGGSQPGPIRTVTRLKGLAFGQAHYAANIQRDYDQRVGISVRNNGDEELMVRLESGHSPDPNMLGSFVGTGSEDKPFPLAAGEERQFQYVISAQDVNLPEHRIPLRIVADSGLSDESELLLHVRLPHVELKWTDMGPSSGNMGRILRLTNVGDAITDLSVVPEQNHAVVLSPTVRHGLLNRGQHMDFTVTPRYYADFKGVKTKIRAIGQETQFDFPFAMTLAPGESMHQVWLVPGLDPHSVAAKSMGETIQAAVDKVRTIDLDKLDWTLATATDLLGRGQPNRWVLDLDDTQWVGTDYDADGIIDHIYTDVGHTGSSEFAALRQDNGWRQTNVVEAWLEMSFSPSLSWEHKPHDVEILLNGVVIGQLEDMIPEGNFSFRIPPGALRFDSSGLPGDNRIGLRTTHLRGGHYVVNSDFRFKFRLTATPVWTAATSADDAADKALALSGVSLFEPDLSLSSALIEVSGPEEPTAGDSMRVDFPIYNYGSIVADNVVVSLQRILPGNTREEVGRVVLDVVAVDHPVNGTISWNIRGGQNNLVLVADPDKSLEDPDQANNEAFFKLTASGDDTPPTLRILQPVAKSTLTSTVVWLEIEADDEDGPIAPAVCIDRGQWRKLPALQGKTTIPLLLQPGRHLLEVQAVDAAGNEALQTVEFVVQHALPAATLNAPATGTTTAAKTITVDVAIPPDVGLVAARTAQGPWHKGSLLGDAAQIEVPLRFGPQTLEVMVADRHGAIQMLEASITRTSQPEANESLTGPAAADQGLLWPEGHAGLEIDLFQAQNDVLKELVLDPEHEATRLWEEARRKQAHGDYAGALTLYRDSLMLKPDPQTDDRIRKLEVYLGIKRMNKGVVQ